MDIPSVKNTKRKHHAEFYFNDGDIVLSAPSMEADALSGPKADVLFKIHKSQLARNSDIFQSMLDLPTPPDGVNEIYDGAPVVALLDSAKEVEDLLEMLYKPWEMKLCKYDSYTCIRVKNALAMSTKYQFNRIRQCIVSHVEADWPTSLEGWDRFEAYIKMMSTNAGLFSKNDLPEPASALVVARLHDIKSILPAIYYDLSRLSFLNDWDVEVARETEIAQSSDGLVPLYFYKRVVRWRLLSGEEFRILQRGKCALRCYLTKVASKVLNVYDIFGEVEDSCAGGCGVEGCQEFRKDVSQQLKEASGRDDMDALKILSKIAESVKEFKFTRGTHHDPCKDCILGTIKVLEEEREKIWVLLPGFFDPTFNAKGIFFSETWEDLINWQE